MGIRSKIENIKDIADDQEVAISLEFLEDSPCCSSCKHEGEEPEKDEKPKQ